MKSFRTPLIFLSALVLICYVFITDKPDSKENTLEANLLAAIELDHKFLTYCGNPIFHKGELKQKTPLFAGLGNHTFPITTSSDEAQKYFDQGLKLAYGFNHSEAHRSFKQASQLDENSPMTYWGQAYAIGPNINDFEIDESRKKIAHENLVKAVELLDKANELEKSLIRALRKRYVQDGDSIRLDNEGYMLAMKEAAGTHSDNVDVLTIFAASVMNTMPWNYWDRELNARPNIDEARDALEKAIRLDPVHPGAHHFNIHITELPFPDIAAKSGDALSDLMPGAGHIVHMPSHAYIRVGRYKDALEANLRAIEADEEYISQCYAQGLYPIGYYPHNIHFLWSAATQMGNSETAIQAARKTAEKTSLQLLRQVTPLQIYASVPMQAYVRFARWNDILTIPYPGDDLKHVKLFWHYSRGMAFINKNDLEEAGEELDSLKSILDDESYNSVYASFNSSAQVAEVAYHLVAAELSAKMNNKKEADIHFNKAIAAEDSLIYNEPPDWHLSTRLNYGKYLNDQKRYQEATRVFNKNLEKLRESGWALMGLYNAYKGLGDESKAEETMSRFREAWKYADIEIKTAVL